MAIATGTAIAIAAALSAAGAGANLGYQISQGSPDQPDPMALAKEQMAAADKSRLSAVVGRSTKDAQVRAPGASPGFYAGLATQEAGTPGLQDESLEMVRKLLAGGGGT